MSTFSLLTFYNIGETIMLPDKTWVTVTKKFNLGNWESIEMSASMSSAVSADENPQDSIDTLFQLCADSIEARVPITYKEDNPQYRERFFKFGKPVEMTKAVSTDEEIHCDVLNDEEYNY